MCDSGVIGFINRHNLQRNKAYLAIEIYNLEPNNYSVKKVVLYAMRTASKIQLKPTGTVQKEMMSPKAQAKLTTIKTGFFSKLFGRRAA